MTIVQCAEGGQGGGQTYLLNLALHIDRSRYEPVFIFAGESGIAGCLAEKGIEVYEIPSLRMFDLAGFLRLMGIFLRIKPFILQTHGARMSLYARSAARLAGCHRVITTLHVSLKSYDIPFLKKHFYFLAERLTSRFASLAVAVTDYLKDDYAGYAGFPRDRISVIYNGVDTVRYAPSADSRRKIREEIGAGEEQFIVGCVGRMVKGKGFEYVLEALDISLKKGRPIKAVFAGDGPLRPGLEDQARSRGIAAEVKFLGNRKNVGEILCALDALVLPSKTEGMPYILLEAMACGCPVVTTNAGGISAVTDNGRYALIVPYASPEAVYQSLLKLMDDRGFASGLSGFARSMVVEKFSIKKSIGLLCMLYDKLNNVR